MAMSMMEAAVLMIFSGHGPYLAEIIRIAAPLIEIPHQTVRGGPPGAAPSPILPGGFDQLYGRYAIRFRADAVPGYKTAWLLWPSSDSTADGEIDFPEGDLDGTISAFMHHQGGGSQDAYTTSSVYTGWHVAIIE